MLSACKRIHRGMHLGWAGITGVWMSVVIALLGGAGGLQAEAPWFRTSARSFHTGDQIIEHAFRPMGMDVGDLDGDGDVDVVLAHYGNFISPKISVHFNSGDGTLGPPAYYTVPGETSDVVATDLDGDLDIDLAFTEEHHYDGARLFVLLNDGTGQFSPPLITVIGRDPTRLIAFDADNDGDTDLACSNGWVVEQVVVMYNDGAANFAPVYLSGFGGEPFDLDAGDLNGDGWPDLAVSIGQTSSSVALLMNNGQGQFHAPVMSNGPFGWPAMAIADTDGDNDLDLIVSSEMMINNGDGTFQPPQPLPTPPLFTSLSDVTCADVNGDDAVDLLGVALASNDAGWLLIESSAGTFTDATQFRSGQYARSIEAADMDGDADLEVIIANGHSLTIKIHFNDNGSFALPQVSSPGSGLAHGMDAADIDLDGDLDVVAGAYEVFRHVNDGTGNFDVFEVETIPGRKYDFKLSDVNGDDYPDMLFVRHPDTPPYNLYVNLNNGDGTFGPTTTWLLQASCGTRDIETLDWDNDGDLDVAITDHLGCMGVEGVRLHLVENNGNGTFQPDNYVVDFTIPDTYRLVTGDFDLDGLEDIVTTQSETVAFWRGHGDGTFGAPLESDIDPQPSNERTPWFMTTDDFNDDGIPDIATANLGWTLRGENITVLLGNGDGSFTAVGLYYTAHALSLAGTGGLGTLDVDHDGDRDLVVGAIYGANIVPLLNDGTGSFEVIEHYGLDGNPANLRCGDFDGDGLEDVAAHVARHFEGGVSVLPGSAGQIDADLDGDGVVGAGDLALLLGAWGPCPKCAADFNGDGRIGAEDLAVLLGAWG